MQFLCHTVYLPYSFSVAQFLSHLCVSMMENSEPPIMENNSKTFLAGAHTDLSAIKLLLDHGLLGCHWGPRSGSSDQARTSATTCSGHSNHSNDAQCVPLCAQPAAHSPAWATHRVAESLTVGNTKAEGVTVPNVSASTWGSVDTVAICLVVICCLMQIMTCARVSPIVTLWATERNDLNSLL